MNHAPRILWSTTAAAGPPPAAKPPAPDSKALDDRIERRATAIGRRIFRETRRASSGLLDPKAKAEKLVLSLMMGDPELRYRLLRFVDVYPALRSNAEIAERLDEYLHARSLATGGAGRLSALARRLGRERPLSRGAIGLASRFAIETAGRQFIAGRNPREVAPRIRAMERQGLAFSLDLLGEFVASETQADDYARRYREMIEGLGALLGGGDSALGADAGPRVNISIKLTSLASKFDPMDPEGTARAVLSRLRPLFRAAKASGAFLNIDMEKYEYRDTTIDIMQRLLSEDEFRGFPHVGMVMQAYLKDGAEAQARLLDWLRANEQPMTLRLVKGAYWDSEQIWANQRGWPNPVITDKRETDAQFERMARQLLESHDLVRTAIASHNVRSLAYALACKEELRVPDGRFEFQMLYGMAGPILGGLLATGLPVRVYTPCGEIIPGMAYLVRRLLENTANESFLKQRFTDGVAEDALLRDPKRVPPLTLSPGAKR